MRGLLPPGARGRLIGTLAWGGFGVRSDIDLVLSGVDDPHGRPLAARPRRTVG